ncbi:MAG: biotin/lipoyl-binding protein [Alphaproteobacteria bacterium]|nr:MAG: biotin/lipoyl-binding protein [Alphaproteobacteria bacterium]
MIRRLLIANRGEIAVRIIRTARAMGIETVAVYSDADRTAQHVQLADRAVHIGPSPVGQSYLNIDRVIAAAADAGADAIHPGYGFLSENAAFAEAVAKAGLVFVGPTADVIAKMGDKREARLIAQAAGVPCVPGFDGADRSDANLKAEAEKLGVPLMIKATAGGGGRGLRKVESLDGFDEALAAARREAGAAFGSGDVLLERVIAPARHVEVQILADSHGTVLHLGERDCSAQRRHQKVLEEAPCATISDTTRTGLHDAAVALAKAVGYTGAGTVEFLVDEDGAFYFLEMNTRLQVEHPVTEAITGLDLVAEQIRIAGGEKLAFGQADVAFTGHAIEARLYAEDPAHSFLPQTGTLHRLAFSHEGRTDSGVVAGDTVSPFYDPMLAKLIAHGRTRDEALQKLARMLATSHIAGVTTNKAYLAHILAGEGFRTASHRTGTLDTAAFTPPAPGFHEAAMAAAAILLDGLKRFPNPHLAGWRTVHHVPERRTILVGDTRFALSLTHTRTPDGWRISVTDGTAEATFPEADLSVATLAAGHVWLDLPTGHVAATDVTLAPPEKQARGGTGQLRAPMDGQVVAVNARAGDLVKAGDLIVVIEAMKMEHQVRADIDGTIADIAVSAGTQVKGRQHLASIKGTET